MTDHEVDRRRWVAARSGAPVQMWEVNEQLLLGSLREYDLANQFQRQLVFSRAIAESLAEGVCAIDQAGMITFVNPAAERLLGRPEAELRAQDAQAILYGVSNSSASSPLLDILQSGSTYRNDRALFRRKDGTTFPVVYSVAPLIVDAQVMGAVVAFDDLTEVQRLYQMQEEYLALLSHDLRTPLTMILGYAQLLVRQLQEAALERAARDAEAIVTSGARMNRLIQDVLDRSRLSAGHTELRLVSVDLVQLVTRSIDQNLLPAERARVELETVAQLPVVADPLQMERVIVNLLTNACKFSSPTAPVLVRVFKIERDAMLSVTDQGVGIGPEDLPHLFEKHFRAATAGTVAGNGLGLYGSRLIVEAHGGRIWLQSAVGTGSTFLVSLPVSEPSSNDPSQTDEHTGAVGS